MEFLQRTKPYLISTGKTLLICPLIIFLSLVTGIAECSRYFLLPSLLITLSFAILSFVHPIALTILASGTIAAGLGVAIFAIYQALRNGLTFTHLRDFENSNVQKFLNTLLLSATLLSSGVLALLLPLQLFFMVAQYIRLAVCSIYTGVFIVGLTKMCFCHFLNRCHQSDIAASADRALQDEDTGEYQTEMQAFHSSYEDALSRLPRHLSDVVDEQNTERDYLGTISRDILFKPVRIEQSSTRYIYEKTVLLKYLSRYDNKDPGTQEELSDIRLEEQDDLRDKIQAHSQRLFNWVRSHSRGEMEATPEDTFINEVYSP